MKTKKQNGFTLIELLLVLAAIAALTVIAFITYPKVQAGRAATAEAQILAGAQAQIKSLYTSGLYASLTPAVAVNMGAFPDNMKATASTIANQWNGAVGVIGSTATGEAGSTSNENRYFSITYTGVPADVCKKLVPAVAGSFGRVAVASTTTPATTAAPITSTVVMDSYASTPIALNESAIASSCGNATATITMVAR